MLFRGQGWWRPPRCLAVFLFCCFIATAMRSSYGNTVPGHTDGALVCDDSPRPDDMRLLGQGRCVDAVGNTTHSFTCPTFDNMTTTCPEASDVDSCWLLCNSNAECTGFELRNVPGFHHTQCFVFTATRPLGTPTAWPWQGVNGTQPRTKASEGRVVIKADGDRKSCCYKVGGCSVGGSSLCVD